MHLLIDQNIPPRVADELSALGYSVDHVSRVGLAQASDPEIIRFALHRGMTLVTQDLGLALWMPHPHFGLLILRRIPTSQNGRFHRRNPSGFEHEGDLAPESHCND